MLNYVKAELYKVWRGRGLRWGLPALLLLEILLLTLTSGPGEKTMLLGDSISLLRGLLFSGFGLLILPAGVVFADQYKHKTLGNEVEFGIPRARIYLGKLLTALLLDALTCLLAVAVWVGWGVLLFGAGADLSTHLVALREDLLAMLPLWLGALGFFHALQFLIQSSTLPYFFYLGYFIAVESGIFMLAQWSPFFALLRHASLLTHLDGVKDPLGAWLVGLGWLVVTTFVGLGIFHRRDVP